MSTVKVYYNLHRQCWSLKRSGEPVRHAESVLLRNCTFVVWQSGRERVLRERRKHVHAFAQGVDCGIAEPTLYEALGLRRATYNPYRNPTRPGMFYLKDTGENIIGADAAYLLEDGTLWVENPIVANNKRKKSLSRGSRA